MRVRMLILDLLFCCQKLFDFFISNGREQHVKDSIMGNRGFATFSARHDCTHKVRANRVRPSKPQSNLILKSLRCKRLTIRLLPKMKK